MQSSLFPTENTPRGRGCPVTGRAVVGGLLLFPSSVHQHFPKVFFLSVDDWLPPGVSYSGLPVSAAATSPAPLRVSPPCVPSPPGCSLPRTSSHPSNSSSPRCSQLLLPRPVLQLSVFVSPLQLLLSEEASAPTHSSLQGSSPRSCPTRLPPTTPHIFCLPQRPPGFDHLRPAGLCV